MSTSKFKAPLQEEGHCHPPRLLNCHPLHCVLHLCVFAPANSCAGGRSPSRHLIPFLLAWQTPTYDSTFKAQFKTSPSLGSLADFQ